MRAHAQTNCTYIHVSLVDGMTYSKLRKLSSLCIMCDDSPISEEENDMPKLSAGTLAVLQEFYREKNEKIEKERQGGIGENWVCNQ